MAEISNVNTPIMGGFKSSTNYVQCKPMLDRKITHSLTTDTNRIVGTLKVRSSPDSIPISRRVALINQDSGYMVQVTWSDPVTGAYEFTKLPNTCKYTVIAQDYTGTYKAVIANDLEATL